MFICYREENCSYCDKLKFWKLLTLFCSILIFLYSYFEILLEMVKGVNLLPAKAFDSKSAPLQLMFGSLFSWELCMASQTRQTKAAIETIR